LASNRVGFKFGTISQNVQEEKEEEVFLLVTLTPASGVKS
jgi:hypothetical protein